MKLPYSIFLDQERYSADIRWITYPENVYWTYVRDYTSFIHMITTHCLPLRISMDFALHPDHTSRCLLSNINGKFSLEDFQHKTGFHCLQWLIKYCSRFKKSLPEIFLHTQNQFALSEMKQLIEDYKNNKSLDNVIRVPMKIESKTLDRTTKIVENLKKTQKIVVPSTPMKLEVYIGEE